MTLVVRVIFCPLREGLEVSLKKKFANQSKSSINIGRSCGCFFLYLTFLRLNLLPTTYFLLPTFLHFPRKILKGPIYGNPRIFEFYSGHYR